MLESEIAAIGRTLKKDERIVAAYVHGSATSGQMRPESDIDIAVLPGPGIVVTQLERLFLNGLLEEQSRRSIDVGVLHTGNLVYVREVVFRGTCLFCKDQAFHDLFVASALGLYAEFHAARKEIVNAYTARRHHPE